VMDADAIQKLYDFGAAQVPARKPNDMELEPFIVVPEGFELKPLTHLQEFPTHIKSAVHVYNPDSFLEYWKKFAGPASLIFADVQAPALTGIVDYHEPTDTQEGQLGPVARWGYHKLSYNFRQTQEWKTWTSMNGKPMKQVDFAQFIENNMADIVEPAAADMFEMVQNFEAKKSVNFSSGVRLNNGQVQFKYEETISTGAAQQGNFTVPETFKLSIAPFEGADNYAVLVRFRYKISAEGLQLRYELVRPHKVIEDAVYTIIGKIQDQLGGKNILYGTAGL
jgi:uncharacterized protein YfdQ (DUF2303 family)